MHIVKLLAKKLQRSKRVSSSQKVNAFTSGSMVSHEANLATLSVGLDMIDMS